MGVISVISLWNMFCILIVCGFVFLMVVGNMIVLKLFEDMFYCGGLFFVEVLEEVGVFVGVFNVVILLCEWVVEMGDELVENLRVKGIFFIGLMLVGWVIVVKVGVYLKKCCVELGGKDSLIVLDDVDMECVI